MSGELILVIDDSQEVVKYLAERLLPTFGYRTKYAEDGRAGLQLIRQDKPDLVMLDLNLPEMTGLDILRDLARDGIETAVVLMTGYGSEKSAVEAFRLGVRDYLIKPFTVDEVVETINRSLAEKRLRQDRSHLSEELRLANTEMRRQLNEMTTLFGIGKTITALLSVDKVLERVLDAAVQLSNAEDSIIWLLDPDSNQLRPYAKKGLDEQDPHTLLMSVETSHVGQVIRTGRPLRQASFSGDGIKLKTGFLARAVLYVPLKLRGVVLGVLGVSNRSAPRAFSERDEFLMSALGDYAAIALENARVFQAADRALAAGMEELNTLIQITRAITSSLDLSEVLRLAIKQVHKNWQIEASSLWLLNESRQTLRVVANVGTPASILHQLEVPVGRGFVGHVVETRKWLYTNDVTNHPLHYNLVDKKTGFHTHSLLCVPLNYRDKVIGALQLVNKQDGEFDDRDVERAMAVATAVAIAVSNALLYKQAESRQQQLEALNAAKSTFVATVSHDLRAPLTSISGLAGALEQIGPLNSQQKQFVNSMTDSVQRMMDLVNGLLDLAKVTTQIEKRRESCDLVALVSEVAADLQGRALSRQITLTLKTPALLDFVMGDPTQLRQAVSNLVDNAIKYSAVGSKIKITVWSQDTRALVRVQDWGVGIAAADLPFIFDEFYRVKERDGEVVEGVGLGLALVRSVAEAHGGQVWVESKKGQGSTFTLQLPLAATEEPAAAEVLSPHDLLSLGAVKPTIPADGGNLLRPAAVALPAAL